MTSTLVDSNVLIDIFEPRSDWFSWSSRQVSRAHIEGAMIVNAVVAAEVAAEFTTLRKFVNAFSAAFWHREEIPFEAAFRAGTAHRAYRLKGGSRERALPDFLVGAHALVNGYRLLTRDARRYRTYFPDLEIIAPDTHP
jgi:predicted nucleic acid-binding protein